MAGLHWNGYQITALEPIQTPKSYSMITGLFAPSAELLATLMIDKPLCTASYKMFVWRSAIEAMLSFDPSTASSMLPGHFTDEPYLASMRDKTLFQHLSMHCPLITL